MTTRSTYLQLLRDNRAFRRLWSADLASLFGDWFNAIALYTAVDELLGTSQAVGWVVVARSLPVLLASPVAGPLVDRLPRRRLMIAADLARAGLGLLLMLSWWAGSAVGLFACTVLQMLAAGVFLPAKNASIPALVGPADVGVANALSGATWSVTLAVGAAAGGFATEAFGVTGAFAIDAATFLVSAWLLRALPPLRPDDGGPSLAAVGAPPADAAAVRRDRGFVAGVRYLARAPGIAPLVLLKSGMAWTSASLPLLTVYGNRVLADSPTPWIVGVLFGARGIGAALGSLLGPRVLGETRPQLERAALCGFAVLAAGYVWLGAAASLPACAVAIALAGVGNALIWVTSSVMLQREVEPGYLGRAFSLDFGLMTGTGAVFIVAVTGVVDADVLTPRGAMTLSGLLAVPPAVVLAFWLRAARRGGPAAPAGTGVTARS